MKCFRIVLALCTILPLSLHAQVEASRSYDVYDSVGVNTHWYYGGTDGYQYLHQFSTLIGLMKQAQIYHFRDGEFAQGYNTPSWITGMYAQLAANGMKAELIVANGQTLSQLESGLQAYPGLEAIEPPNEWDLNGGSNWPTTMLAQLPIVWQAGKDLRLTVLGPSLTQASSFAKLGNVSQYMDYDNMHPYSGGRNPETAGWGGGVDSQGNGYGSIEWNIDMVQEYGPNLAAYATEDGFQTSDTPAQNKIPETVAGAYAPRLVMDFFKHGVKRSYFYELIDDPSWAQPGYGLLRYDLSPKPAFTALSNLLSILQDDSTQFTPETLNYSLTGNMNGVETFLIERSDGTFYLNVWLNGSIYDVNALASTPIAPHALTLSLPSGKTAASIASFNPDGTVTTSTPGGTVYTVNANSCLTMIHIADAAPGNPVTLPSAAAPVFSIGTGSYTSPQSVVMTDATPGAAIYYTIGNSAPTAGSNLYNGPVVVSGSETLNAIAVAAGYSDSPVSSASYTIGAAAPADFSLTQNTASMAVQAGQSGTATLTITPQNGFSSAVTFACSGLPAGAACTFSPSAVTPAGSAPASTTLTVSASGTASALRVWRYGVSVAAIFCCFGWRKRRALQLVLLAASVIGMSFVSGCSGGTSAAGAPAHASTASTVTVTATAGSLQHTATFSLTMN